MIDRPSTDNLHLYPVAQVLYAPYMLEPSIQLVTEMLGSFLPERAMIHLLSKDVKDATLKEASLSFFHSHKDLD